MKKMLSLVLFAVLWFLVGMSAKAEGTKVMTVPIAKNYKEITFYFDFSDGQEHSIYITKPEGDTVSNVVTTDSAVISIEDAAKGDYIVEIIADNEITVKARVECKNNTTAEGNNVTISSALTDLKVFFINGDLAAQWQDTGAGDVNIKVVNPQTLQIIADVKTSESYCVIPLDDTVKKIEVYIVPTSSAKLSGAGIGYTLDVVRSVGAEVIFPEYTITNQTAVSVTIENTQDVKVYSVTNKIEGQTEVFEPGMHEYSIPLVSNDNVISLYVEDMNGNIIYRTFDMKQDMVAPSISLNAQYDGYVTDADHILLEGYARDADKLYINNTELEIDQYERFSCDFPLEDGENNISFCANDIAGNQTVVSLTISRQERKSKLPVILIVLVMIVIISSALWRIKGKKNNGIMKQEDKPQKPRKEKKTKKKPKKVNAENLQKTIKNSTIIAGERSKRMRERKFITEVIVSCVQLGILTIFLLFCVRNTIVASGSMEPALMTNDIVIYNKLSYIFKPIQRGDIINFWSEEYGEFFAKRVIGIEGDVIEFHDGYTFINGQRCDESAYIADGIETNCIKTFVVPEGTVFVMGDNRENSIDSRFFKNPYIPVKDIEGKYLGTIPWIFD